MDLQETIRNIKKDLRQSMNGVASTFMREHGLHYKLNFGVELPRLQLIASRHPTDHDLAQALWKENIRECKLLAAMLQPIDSFYPEIADIWVEDMPNAEIAGHTVQHLFSKLPYASQKAFEWIADAREMHQVCGYLMLARLFMNGQEPNERAEHEFLDQARAALHDTATVRRAACSAIQKYQSINERTERLGENVLNEITPG